MIWFCVQTDLRKERGIAAAIREEARLTAYLPIETVMRKLRGQRVVQGRPLIPRHVFFATDKPDASTFEAVRAIRGVRRILSLSADGSPSRIPAEHIETITMVADELQAAFERRWNKAQEQERRKTDTDEVVARLRRARPEDRVGVLYSLIGRGKKARLKLEDAQQLVRAA